MTGKSLNILHSSVEGGIQAQCEDILGRLDGEVTVLSLVFFFGTPRAEEYGSSEEAILSACRSHFGEALPMVTCVAQKPIGTELAAEALYLRDEAWVEYHEDYLVVTSGEEAELVSRGIHYPSAGDTGAQSKLVFGRLGDILDEEGFKVSDIVRQWNYIEGITSVSDGVQNYQMFNDARSVFYSGADWSGGYPAATGIGCAWGGVTVSIYAVKGFTGLNRPVDNPLQVPAHRYSEKVLEDGGLEVRSTPKFERARILGRTVFISGTAAIKGEDSELMTDPAVQSRAAVEVVENLVDPGNLGCGHFDFEALRVYIKDEADASVIIDSLRSRWHGIPMHFLIADICRPELLLEIEVTGTTGRFLECCCTDAEEATEAEKGGASRIELCEDLPCGGVTPSEENIRRTLSNVNIPVNVLIRVRGGDFVYSEKEISEMVESIKLCKGLGVNAVVIGALRPDGSIDTEACKRLVEAADGLHITFHRAFDECSDPLAALEDIIALGCDRLLTAGHATNVNDGAAMLKTLVHKAGDRITILAGSGVRPANIAWLESMTGVQEFHSSSHGPSGRTSSSTVAAMVL